MAGFIISGSRGTDDPTMATLPFMAAKTAKEQGHDVVLWLWNEAVTLGRKGTAEHVQGVNLPPVKDLLAAVQAARGLDLGLRRLRRGEADRRVRFEGSGGDCAACSGDEAERASRHGAVGPIMIRY
jgi:hypothetical protein